MKKYIVYLMLCFVVSFISSCTSVYENGDTSCIPEGMERLTFKVIVPSSKVVWASTRSTTLGKENEIKDLFVRIGHHEDGFYGNVYSTQNGTINLYSYAYEDSIYGASIEVPVGTFKAGDNIYVCANQEYPIDVTSEEELITPLYMSGMGTIKDKWGDNREFVADVHLLRGVAKLRTVVRTTKRSVMGSWNIDMNQIETQILQMPSCIRLFAPFDSHRNPAANDWWNDPPIQAYDYMDCVMKKNDWWMLSENFHLLSSVELPIDDGVNADKVTETSYDRYIYENWLENESEYDENTNVTTLKVRIPLWNYETVESRIIERVIPIRTHDSYRILRNHIYTLDIRVLSVDKVEIFTDMLDWKDIEITGDMVGADFDIDKKEVTLIKDIADPVKLVKVDCHAPGRLSIRALKSNKTNLISTSDLQLYCNGIAGNDKLADNSGIYDLVAAQTMNFYCTTDSVPANFEGGFVEVSSDNVHVKYIPISSLTTFTPLDTEGTANSYIADKGAGSYSFIATVMGNGANGIIDEGKFEDAMGNILTKAAGADIHPLSAKLLWQDTDELVEQVGLSDGRIYVKMGRSRGNALIAVYDKADPNAEDAKILWSWHLWCTPTPKVIDLNISTHTGNKYKVMDRNLGATTSTPRLGTTQGVHYQWGRKEPFSTSLIYGGNIGSRTILYDVRSLTSKIKIGRERLTMSQAVNHPELYNIADFNFWLQEGNNPYLWGNPEGTDSHFSISTLKTIYDPCPVGYKVPPGDVFLTLAKEGRIYTNLEDEYWIKEIDDYGTTFYCDGAGEDEVKTVYLPHTHDVYSFDVWGRYWASYITENEICPQEERYSASFLFGKGGDYRYPHNLEPARTASVRCVKE